MTKQQRALVAVTDFGVEEPELLTPVGKLRAAGVEVTVASDSGKTIQTVQGDKDWASTYEPDSALDDVSADDFDVLVLPGGTVNADNARGNEQLQSLINAFASAAKPIAAICHAPWTLIDAGRAEGKKLTSYPSLRLDLQNAGSTWVDEELVRCTANDWVLLTSRNPDDLDAFCSGILDELGT
ncbi:type 1 glutamine amidotransferase domain-containing protein [Cumulibacter manganitolerans]|uniref:type 1 glutamine amidotransferase domain-containing protein n=1 Tax=Cumulibacter manganitolerans TaxID=1884992 RepID=UPI001296C4E9|nr:type 1 glutamine amidotransferase domain-containing protein [Cumulibacter manganitolerans]